MLKDRNFRLFLVSTILIATVILTTGCSSSDKPNIVIVLIDMVRDDHTSLSNYERDTTPNMKRIADDGLVLCNFFVNAPWTKPSVATMITGLLPSAHGCRLSDRSFENPKVEVLSTNINTMAEILRENGYKTYAFITNPHLTPRLGFDQGYDTYVFQRYGSTKEIVCDTDRNSIETTIKTLDDNTGAIFAWCHLMCVHQYESPLQFQRFAPDKSKALTPLEEVISEYDNSIYYADHLLGELFDFVCNNEPNTLLVVISDHGEELGERGKTGHGRTLYNELLKVPCVFWGPGVPKEKLTDLTSSIDLLPTILAYSRVDRTSDYSGKVIFDQGKVLGSVQEVFAEQHHSKKFKRFALIRDGKKLIETHNKETGDITIEFYEKSTEIEKDNIASKVDKDTIDKYLKRIEHYKSSNKDYFKKHIGRSQHKELTLEEKEALRALGYLK